MIHSFDTSFMLATYRMRWNILAKHKKYFGWINIGNFDKKISYMCLNLQLGVKINVHVFHHICLFIIYGCTRYGSRSTSAEYLHISAFSLAEYSYWWRHGFLANSACSNFVSHRSASIVVYLLKLVYFDNEISFNGKGTMVCHFYLNTAAMLFCNCNLTQKMTHVHSITWLLLVN